MTDAEELKFWRWAILNMSEADWALLRRRYRTREGLKPRRPGRPGTPEAEARAFVHRILAEWKASGSKSAAFAKEAKAEGPAVTSDTIRKRFERATWTEHDELRKQFRKRQRSIGQ